MLYSKTLERSRHGYVLLGVLALALLVAVAASMALRSSQRKVDQVRNREANAEAKLVLDSAASRFISYLDRNLETHGDLSGADLNNLLASLSSQSPIVSGPFQVRMSQDITVSSTLDLGLQTITASPLQHRPFDPLYPEFLMNTQIFNVTIQAHATQPGYGDFSGTYAVQVRAIPETEWAFFNPGSLRENITLSKDASTGQSQVYAYVGSTNSTLSSLYGVGAPVVAHVANQADPNSRLFHQSDLNFNPSAGGRAKWPNAASTAVGTTFGQYPGGTPNWPDLETFGLQFDPIDMTFDDNYVLSAYTTLASASGSLGPGATANPSPYCIVQVPDGNPFGELTATGGRIAVMDLADYLLHLSSNGKIDVPPPGYIGSAPVNVLYVTNCSPIPNNPEGSVDISFPPTLQVFIGDDVNTNFARLRMEGNIGFVPAMTNLLQITNFVNSPRVLTGFATNIFMLTNVASLGMQADLTNQVFLDGTDAGRQLKAALQQWAESLQQRLVSDPRSPLFITNAAAVNYMLDQLQVLSLSESVLPRISQVTDWSTNLPTGLSTNSFIQYGYANIFIGNQYCQDTGLEFAFLNSQIRDSYLNNAIPLDSFVPGQPFSEQQQSQDNGVISTSFSATDPLTGLSIPIVHSYIASFSDPTLRTNVDEAQLYSWMPSNIVYQLPAMSSPTTLSNVNLRPFAIAYITIYTNYPEHYEEDLQLPDYADSLVTAVATNGPSPRSIPPTPDGLIWRSNLWSAWQQAVTTLGVTSIPHPGASMDRYDSMGNIVFTGPEDYSIGPWEMSTDVTMQQSPSFKLSRNNTRTEQDITDTALKAQFQQRVIQFNYQTMGWGLTNINVILGEAPSFNGRLVVEDGIKQLLNLSTTNLVINGQLTYTHRNKSWQQNEFLAHAVWVNHNRATIPAACSERLFDVRLSRAEIERNSP